MQSGDHLCFSDLGGLRGSVVIDGEPTGTTDHEIQGASEGDIEHQTTDPFGYQGTAACGDVIRNFEEQLARRRKKRSDAEASWQKCTWLLSATAGTAQLLSAKPRVIGWNAEHNRVVGSDPEEMGARKAAGMTRSWKRPELIACYVLLVLLTNLIHLCVVLCPAAVRNALTDLSCTALPPRWQCELHAYLLQLSKIIAPLIFAKIANSYSRPWSLFLASLISVSGLAIAFSSVSIGVYSSGMVQMDFGLTGLFAVATIIVADSSDLVSRTFYIWCCHCTLPLWMWLAPWMERGLASWGENAETNWRNATFVFFGGVTAFTIPNATALYLYIRRAEAQGYISHSHRRYSWSIWKPRQLWENIQNFSARNDLLGLSAWNIAIIFLTAPLICAYWCPHRHWAMLSAVVGVTVAFAFVIWELYLGGVFSAAECERDTTETHVQDNVLPQTLRSPRASPRVLIVATPMTRPDENLDELAALTFARLKRREHRNSFRETCDALLPGSLFESSQVFVPIACSFLESFSRVFSLWILRQAPALDMWFAWQAILYRINISCVTFSGLLVALCIPRWRDIQPFIGFGLLLQLISSLAMLKGCLWGEMVLESLYVPTLLQGLGSGFADVPLLVAAQAGCVRRGDIATATGLSLSLKALAELSALAFCRAVQRYYGPIVEMDILRPVDYGVDGRDPVKSVWSVLIIISILVFALALATIVTFLHNDDLTKRQQHVTGTVFGSPDASTSEKEDQASDVLSEAQSFRSLSPVISPV